MGRGTAHGPEACKASCPPQRPLLSAACRQALCGLTGMGVGVCEESTKVLSGCGGGRSEW